MLPGHCRISMRWVLLPVLAALLTACGSPSNPPVTQVLIADLAADDSGTRRLATDRFTIGLRIPHSGNPRVESDIAEFLQPFVNDLVSSTVDEPEPGYFNGRQYTLESDWETAESDTIYSFIVRGHLYTGGAHALPFVQTFSYSKSDDERLMLQDLLAGEQSLAEISAMAKQHFAASLPTSMTEDGLAPDWSNWQNWFVSNNRISFIFPVYQIAPYSDGEQMYSVMVDPGTQQFFNLDYFEVYEPAVSIVDQHGHGPDPGTEEAARAATWQLIRKSPDYVEDGQGLEITNIQRLSDESWLVDYRWQRQRDPGGDYSGQVRVVNDRPEFVERQKN